MKQPTDFQLSQLAHIYDPIKAHEYYMRKRHLKGRKKGSAPPPPGQANPPQGPKVLLPHRKAKGSKTLKEQQKVKLKSHIDALQTRLVRLEKLIKQKEATLAKDQKLNKGKAKQNRKGKAKGPQSAAQKAAHKQKNKQYQQTHKQQLKLKAQQRKAAGGGGGAKGTKTGTQKPDAKKSIAELKALATKVRGLIAVAQEKLAAL
jgi:hypothetical protein